MKSLLNILLGLIGLVIVLVVAAAVTIATLDPNEHKDWIVAKLQEKTGRTITIDGNISLEIYPWLGLEADNVTLSNARGFGPEPFLKVAHLKARIKLLPLLREQYEIDTVLLHGAVINLARNKDGVSNWADLSSGDQAKGKPLPLTAIMLGGVDIKEAQFTWSDEATGSRYVIKNLTATTGALSYGKPIQLALSLVGTSNKPAVDGDFKMDGVIDYNLDAEKYSIKPLALTGKLRGKNVPGGEAPLSLSGAIEADLAEDTATVSDLKFDFLQTQVAGKLELAKVKSPRPSVKADLDVQGSDLALLFKVFEIEPLASQIAQIADRKFNLKARLDADLESGDIDLPEFNASLLGSKVQGQLKATNTHSPTPGVKGVIDAAGPDLPSLLKVAGQFQGGSKSVLSRYGQQLANAPDHAFSIKTTFDADLKRGVVDVPKLSARIAGATLEGRVSAANVQSDTPSYKGMLNAAGPDLPMFLRLAGADGGKESSLAVYGTRLAAMPDKSFAVKADFDADLKKGNIDLPALSIQTLGIDVAGKLKATNMESSSGSVTGQLAVKGEKLADLLKALDQAGLSEVLRSVNFETVISGTRSDLNLKPMALKAVVASPEIKGSPVTVSLNADSRINLDKQSLQLDNLTLQGLGLNVQGNVLASKIMEAPEFRGDMVVNDFNLRQLLRELKQEPPKTADSAVLNKLGLKTAFAGSMTGISLSKLAVKLDDSSLTGDLSIDNFEKPVVRFGFDVDQIDFDRYLPPPPPEDAQKPGERKKNVKLGGAASAAASIPVEELRAIDIEGSLKAGRLAMSGIKVNNLKTTLKGKNGLLKLDPIDADLYQGTNSGNVTLDATGNVPKLTLNTKMVGIQAEPLLKDATGEAKLKGTGSFSAALVAVGTNTDQFKQTLNGQMSFTLKDGALKGYNLGKIMRLGNALSQNFSLAVSDKEQTDLSDVTGNPVAQNGVIRMDDFAGKSPGLRLGGKGVLADLPRNLIDYRITANLVATSKGQGGKDLEEGKLEGVPLDCTVKGSLDAPKRECDASKLLAAMGVKLLQGVLTTPEGLVPGIPGLSGATSGATGTAGAVGAAGAAAAGALGGLFGGKDKSDDSKSNITAPKSTAPAPAPKPAAKPPATTTTAPKSTITKPATTTPAPKPAAKPPATTTTAPKSAITAPVTTMPKPVTKAPATAPKPVAKPPAAATAAPKSAATEAAEAAAAKKKEEKKKKKAAKAAAAAAAAEASPATAATAPPAEAADTPAEEAAPPADVAAEPEAAASESEAAAPAPAEAEPEAATPP